jgi:serine beta-lactamase-like protein LACTB
MKEYPGKAAIAYPVNIMGGRAIIFGFFFAVSAPAQIAPPIGTAGLDSIIGNAFKSTRCPGLSVALSIRNSVVYSKALGFADVEQGVPLTSDSVHRLASVSKLVTATMIMDLVQAGKLKLDIPIKTYLTDLPSTYDKITVRHLLSHQAGIREYRVPDEVFSIIHYPTSRDALTAFVNDALLFEPGTKTEYTTFGFTMLGAIAEAVTAKSFQSFSEDFFRRYEIKGMGIDDSLAIVRKRVRGYKVDENGSVANARAYDASNKYPAGGFTASAKDFLGFMIAVGSGRVLKEDILRQTWTRQKTSDGMQSPFGLGWGVSERDSRIMVGFNGLQPSTTTSVRYFPAEGAGVALFCNAEVTDAEANRSFSKLLDDLVGAILAPK